MTDANTVGTYGVDYMPRLSLADIEAKVVKTHFHIVPGTTSTVCTLVLANGFTVTGTSACVNTADFNKVTGENFARENALNKVWELEGYLLKERQSKLGRTLDERVADELATVSMNLGRLNSLLNRSERPKFISAVHWALLHGQKKAMELYSKILLKRLELFERGE